MAPIETPWDLCRPLRDLFGIPSNQSVINNNKGGGSRKKRKGKGKKKKKKGKKR